MFGQGRRLDKEEPPPHVLRRKLLIGLSIHRQRRSDVHEANLFDAFGKVETRQMGDATTPIVGTHKKVVSTVLVRTYPTAPLIELSNPRHGS